MRAFWQVWELEPPHLGGLPSWSWLGWLWADSCSAKALQDSGQRRKIVTLSAAGGAPPDPGLCGLGQASGPQWWSLGDKYSGEPPMGYLYASFCDASRLSEGTSLDLGVRDYPSGAWLSGGLPATCGW